MSSVGVAGSKKEWNALVKLYDYLYSTYPDFRKQVDEFGFSTIETNDKGELILEMDSKDSDIVVDGDRVVKILKKEGIKRFTRVESLTLDRVLCYDYDMVKGLLNILIRRGTNSSLYLNLHFYYIESDKVPKLDVFLKKRSGEGWGKVVDLGDYNGVFNSIIEKKLNKEGLTWLHMVGGTLNRSIIVDGDIEESLGYGSDNEFDGKVVSLLDALSEIYDPPVKEVFFLGDEVNKVTCRRNNDGEITVVAY